VLLRPGAALALLGAREDEVAGGHTDLSTLWGSAADLAIDQLVSATSLLEDSARFSLEPALSLNRGAFAPAAGLTLFGSIGDFAPDTWGRRLMQRAER
jgi:hypothetical protein